MKLTRTAEPDSETRLAVSGELDLASGPLLVDELDELLTAGNAVVLDLSEVEFIDSAGLVAILRAVDAARRSDASLEVRPEVTPAVRRLLELTLADAVLWPR